MQQSIILNMKILCIPVVSTRSYETGLYNLSSDGNIQCLRKFLSYTKKRWDDVSVVLPTNVDEHKYDAVKSFVNNCIPGVDFENALAQRVDEGSKLFEIVLREIITSYIKKEPYDYVLYAGQEVGKKLECVKTKYGFKTIYFDNTMAMTADCEMNSRLERWKDDDEVLASLADEAVFSTTEQCEYHRKTYALDTIVDFDSIISDYKNLLKDTETKLKSINLQKTLEDFDVFHTYVCIFPYRLSDPVYHVEDTIELLDSLSSDRIGFVITDPNDCATINGDGSLTLKDANAGTEKTLEPTNVDFIKVPCEKWAYYTLLDKAGSEPLWFTVNVDDLSNNMHINVDEMKAFGVNGVFGKGKDHHFAEGSYRVNDYSKENLKSALAAMLNSKFNKLF